MGALDVNKVIHGHQGWRLITCNWLHAGVIHILANMLSLLFIGIRLEQDFGFGMQLINHSFIYSLTSVMLKTKPKHHIAMRKHLFLRLYITTRKYVVMLLMLVMLTKQLEIALPMEYLGNTFISCFFRLRFLTQYGTITQACFQLSSSMFLVMSCLRDTITALL